MTLRYVVLNTVIYVAVSVCYVFDIIGVSVPCPFQSLCLIAIFLYIVQVQTKRVTKLCNSKEIVTVNGMYPGPVVYAEEDDRIIVKVTNKTPFNVTIHW